MNDTDMDEESKAWRAYLAGWLEAKGISDPVQELGLAWSGYGGENQLKERFRLWYEGQRSLIN